MALGTLALITNAAGASASEPTFFEEVSLVGPASYTTGGDTGLQAAYRALGNAQALRTIINVLPVDGKGYTPAWDSANGKLLFYYSDNNNASDSAQIQVPSTTDLSGVTFRLMIVSK